MISYQTVSQEASDEFVERRSRFIGHAKPVQTEEEAVAFNLSHSNVLLKSNVTNTVVVVTRYFGGVLLGAGGLVRAYSHGASIALQAAQVITMKTCLLMEFVCDYNQYGRLSSLVPECGGVVDDAAFTDTVKMQFHLPDTDLEGFRKRLADATNGSVTAEIQGEEFFLEK